MRRGDAGRSSEWISGIVAEDFMSDMSFDIDALFDHMTKNLGHDLSDEKDWTFTLRTANFASLQQAADDLQDEFVVQLQETVEEYDSAGNFSLGRPMLSVVKRAALSASDVKKIVKRIESIAQERGFDYEGVNCYDPFNDEEIFGWLIPADARWRLRHMTDCGLVENAELPWSFLVQSQDLKSIKMISSELDSNDLTDRDDYDEPDENGNFAICVFLLGRNNEIELDAMCERIAEIAERHGGQLEGVQFYTREQLNEVFGLDGAE